MNTVMPIVRHAKDDCDSRAIHFSLHFTSNSYLLNDEMISSLESPICEGGCRTKCLEQMHHEECNIGLTMDKMDSMILDRFEERFL